MKVEDSLTSNLSTQEVLAEMDELVEFLTANQLRTDLLPAAVRLGVMHCELDKRARHSLNGLLEVIFASREAGGL